MKREQLASFIQKLPKAELHIHLEGAVPPQTVLDLAKHNRMLDVLPFQKAEDLHNWFHYKDFNHFVDIIMTVQKLMQTPEDFALIAYQLGQDMAQQNILYREATLTPYTHIDHQDKGLTIEDILNGLEEGRQKAKADFGVEIRWVFDIHRNLSFMINQDGSYHPDPAEKTFEYALKGIGKGVIGLGIGGNEVGAPAQAFQQTFTRAKQAGLLSVPHAGETMGPTSIWESLKVLQADRIGHGVRAVEDPILMDFLRQHQVTLEVNPTSNLKLKIYPSIEAHPFQKLDNFGIPVTINSDDPTLFNTNLSQEYALVAEAFGYTPIDLARIARNAFLAAGAEAGVKHGLLERFDEVVKKIL